MLSLPLLVACGVAPTPARAALAPLQAACSKFSIDTEGRIAAFLGQCMVESKGFTEFEENLWWTTPARVLDFFPSRVSTLDQAAQLVRNPQALANCVYAGKCGNGPAASGDGWLYRARGGLGLTGRDNYSAAALATGRPYLEQPELVGQPVDAMLAAGWFWNQNRLNTLADRWQIDAITRAVNGPRLADRDLRRQYSLAALIGTRKGLST